MREKSQEHLQFNINPTHGICNDSSQHLFYTPKGTGFGSEHQRIRLSKYSGSADLHAFIQILRVKIAHLVYFRVFSELTCAQL